MKGKVIGYWITTVLAAFPMLMGGAFDVMNGPDAREIMTHLGYPMYVAPMLGVWKVLGAIVILAPRLPRAKEWAYAGIVIDLVGASVSHMKSGDGPDKWALPFILVAMTVASSILRPPGRVLGTIMPGASSAPATGTATAT